MRQLMKGNEAIAEAALRAGCNAFFGYPITPQNEIPEYIARQLPKHPDFAFVQMESEVAAINAVYGAAAAGARVLTSSSSPGMSLKQEGISYIAGAELPCVIVNIARCGPGLGGILPAQGDYFQAVKGGGHGDYKCLVYGPESAQEAVDMVYGAFDTAEKYRIPVIVLGDGILGQMIEPVVLPPQKGKAPKKAWAADGSGIGKDRRTVSSLFINPDLFEQFNNRKFKEFAELAKVETRVEEVQTDDAEVVFVAYGIVARVCKGAIKILREKGIKAGLVRPITLSPFPNDTLSKVADKASVKKFVAVEMSMGQMVQDARLAINGKKEVLFYGRCGGNAPSSEELAEYISKNI
jgi:2-oxoglutarate ferredoxin oxidoreductase subunit alpha